VLLDASTTSIVAVAGAAVGVVGLGTALAALQRLGRLRRSYAALAGDVEHGDVLEVMGRHLEQVGLLREQVGRLDQALGQAQDQVADAIRHVAVVRYDAFQDMGGRMSYSAALLDDSGDGLVLTSINGRSEARTYAKGVKDGRSDHEMSPEEAQAVGYALRGMGGAPAPTQPVRDDGRDAAAAGHER
jgi:hypothetical protein